MTMPPSQSVVPARQDFETAVLVSLLLSIAAAVLAVAGDAPQVFFTTAAGLGFSLLRRRPLPRSSRSFIYSGLAVLLATALGAQFFPIPPGRFFLAPSEVYGPFVLYVGVAMAWFDQRESNLTAIIALALLGLMLAGNAMSPLPRNKHMFLPNAWTQDFVRFYGIALFLEFCILWRLLRRAYARRPPAASPRRRRAAALLRSVFLVAGMLGVVVTVAGLRSLVKSYEQSLQSLFATWYRQMLAGRGSRILFPNDVDLWWSVSAKQRQDRIIALRVVCPGSSPPGYLRARAYSFYRRGQWQAGRAAGTLEKSEPGGPLAYLIFRRRAGRGSRAGPGRQRRLQVYPGSGFSGTVVPVPGGATAVEMLASDLQTDLDGTLTAVDWAPGTGYTVTAPPASAQAFDRPVPVLNARHSRFLTQVPKALRPVLEKTLGSIFPHGWRRLSSRAKIAGIRAFFLRGFRYELGVHFGPSGPDPIVQFLARRRGHCELFATAAVLLLRTAGVPARYVTGFVCAERHPAGLYWVARLEDAHAWAEAWDGEARHWRLVDCTPGGGRAPDSRFSALGAWLDRIVLGWQKYLTEMKDGFVAQALTGAFLGIFRFLWSLLVHPIRGPIFLGLAAGILLRRQARRRRRLLEERAELGEVKQRLRQGFQRLEKFLARRGVVRAPWMTLRMLAEAVRRKFPQEEAARIVGLLEWYEELRYGAGPGRPEAAKEFLARIRRLERRQG